MRDRGSGRGWYDFSGALFAIVGLFNGVQGLAAIFNKEYFQGAVVLYDRLQFWGWAWLIIGVVQVVVAAALFDGRARIAGIVLAALSSVVSFASLGAAPSWSALVIAVNVAVIYGLTVHGHPTVDAELEPGSASAQVERLSPPPPR